MKGQGWGGALRSSLTLHEPARKSRMGEVDRGSQVCGASEPDQQLRLAARARRPRLALAACRRYEAGDEPAGRLPWSIRYGEPPA